MVMLIISDSEPKQHMKELVVLSYFLRMSYSYLIILEQMGAFLRMCFDEETLKETLYVWTKCYYQPKSYSLCLVVVWESEVIEMNCVFNWLRLSVLWI